MSLRSSLLRPAAVVLILAALSACGGAETRKARHLQRGETYMAEENYEKARVEFRNALQIAPTDSQARFLAARVAEKLKNPAEAAGLYQAVIEADPNHIQARANLGRLYIFAGASKLALELVEVALAKAEDADLLTVRAAARMQTGDTVGALADGTRAVELNADNENALAVLASIYRQNGQSEQALALVRDGVKRHPKSSDLRLVLAQLCLQAGDRACAERELGQIIVLNPQEQSFRYQLALFHLAAKNVDKAEQVLRETVKAVPKDNGPKFALVDFLANQRSVAVAEREYQDFIVREPKNAQLQLGLGQFYERNKQADRAEGLYRKIIEQERLSAEGLGARNRLAALKAQAGRYDEAGALIAEVLKENPRDNDALILRGNIALSRSDPTTAIADLRAVLRDQPKAIGVLRALARAHLQNNEPGLAEESLRAAVAASPKDVDARTDLAQLLAQRGQLPQSVELLEQIVREAPQNVAAREILFRTQVAAEQWDAARRTAEDIKLLKPESALGFYFAGLVAEAQKASDLGAAQFERALELQPDASEPLAALVRVKLVQKQTDAALGRLDAQIKLLPSNALARNLKGEVLLAAKRYPEAAAELQGAIERAPQWWLPYRNLALSQLARQDVAAAAETYQRGLKAAKESAPLALDLGGLYERNGQPEQAIGVYETLLGREPRSEMAANNLAMLLVTHRKDRESIDRAQELAARFANSTVPAYLNTYGWVKFKRGEVDAALPTLEQAVEKSPDSPLLRYHLGMAQFQAGRLEQARENLRLAVAPGKRFAGVDEARATLEQINKKNSG